MQRIISVILSILILLFGTLIPGLANKEKGITQGEWLSKVDSEFGMNTYESQKPYYPNVTPENKYFAAVQIAYEWGVIDSSDKIDTEANVTNEFGAKTLVKVANLEAVEGKEVLIKNADDLKYANEVAIAVTHDLAKLKADNSFMVVDLAYDQAVKALEKTKEIWSGLKLSSKSAAEVEYSEPVNEIATNDYVIDGDKVTLPAGTQVNAGETIVLPQNAENVEGAVMSVESVKTVDGKTVVEATPVDAEEVIESVKFEGAVTPNLSASKITDAQGNVIQTASIDNEGALADLIKSKLSNFSFNVGAAKVNVSVKDNGFDVSIGGSVCDGVYLSDTFSVSNLVVQTKLDANIAQGNIKEAYVVLDYDCTNTASVTGAQNWGLVSENTDDNSSLSLIDQIKANLSDLKLKAGAYSKINVFSVAVPIPDCPEITITLDISLQLSVSGRAELVISSHNYNGFEIINNKGRFINATTQRSNSFNAYGSAEATGCISVGVGVLTYDVMDLDVNAGLGATVYTNITLPAKGDDVTSISEELPADMVAQAVAVLDDADEFGISGKVTIYGILRISVGENSLMGKIGLKKSWSIFDKNNGTIFEYEF
ncbi:MAG: hypothetical protein IJU39_07610 [Clostridia bacterium]|nr:hypothetical protein [Clostridia bacterium]